MQFFYLFLCLLIVSTPIPLTANQDLPVLTDAMSSTLSRHQEYQLGRTWVRSLRGHIKLLDDPLTVSYLNDLSWELVGHSQLQDRRIDLVAIDNPTFNAFAVPGGIIGIHGGLIVAAEQEDELASVLAHELAHLSQRHYAASLENARRNRPWAIAGLLAGILIAAADSQAGSAALSTSMAAQQASRLAFSRQNEREADRVGMQTLVAAGIDPRAMPRMFSRMQASQRFLTKPPEFLLTHPVTEARLADSLNRAEQLESHPLANDSIDFALIKARMAVYYSTTPQAAFMHYQTQVQSSPTPEAQYALAMAAIHLNRFTQAKHLLDHLPRQWKQHLFVQLTRIEADLGQQQWSAAIRQLDQLAAIYPNHFALELRRAEAYMGASRYDDAVRVLSDLKQHHPTNVTTHYLLAEALGQAGRSIAVHEARVDYFLLTGQVDRARTQIEFARRENGLTPSDRARLDQLEAETKIVHEQMRTLL